MSATKPEFHLDLFDGAKKVRQKIGKSFCEPGNAKGNIALELCRTFVFPFNKFRLNLMNDEATESKVTKPGMTIERAPENGGNLEIQIFEELEAHFISSKLHPADLKAFLCSNITQIFEAIRDGRYLFTQSKKT